MKHSSRIYPIATLASFMILSTASTQAIIDPNIQERLQWHQVITLSSIVAAFTTLIIVVFWSLFGESFIQKRTRDRCNQKIGTDKNLKSQTNSINNVHMDNKLEEIYKKIDNLTTTIDESRDFAKLRLVLHEEISSIKSFMLVEIRGIKSYIEKHSDNNRGNIDERLSNEDSSEIGFKKRSSKDLDNSGKFSIISENYSLMSHVIECFENGNLEYFRSNSRFKPMIDRNAEKGRLNNNGLPAFELETCGSTEASFLMFEELNEFWLIPNAASPWLEILIKQIQESNSLAFEFKTSPTNRLYLHKAAKLQREKSGKWSIAEPGLIEI